MRVSRPSVASLLALLVSVPALDVFAKEEIPLRNWSVPSGPALQGSAFAYGTVFVPVTPCRIADTRDPAGAYGGPILPASTERSFDINSHPSCTGIPNASAYSLNFTIVAQPSTPAGSFITVWPTGLAMPLASTQNFGPGSVLANAAIVPAGTNGAISVISNTSIHIIIDINGYFTTELLAGNAVQLNGALASNALLNVFNAGTDGTGVHGSASGTGKGAGVLGEDSVGAPNPSGLSAGVVGLGKNGVVGSTKTSIGFGVWGKRYNAAGTTTLSEGLLGANFGSEFGLYAFVGGIGCSSCAKLFVDPHPSDPSKVIRYVALEGGEAGTYFRGTAALKDGEAVITVPDHFRFVTDEEGLTVHLTPRGGPSSIWVVSSDLRTIVVHGTRDVRFDYLVHGIRPAFKDWEPIVDGTNFVPRGADDPMPEGWPEWTKRRLVENGTYTEDGHLNRETARRLGWNSPSRDAK